MGLDGTIAGVLMLQGENWPEQGERVGLNAVRYKKTFSTSENYTLVLMGDIDNNE